MRERDLEWACCKLLRKKYNALAIKVVNPYESGWPDRIICPPDQPAFFIEFKRLGRKPTKLQLHRHALLRSRGHHVYVVDSLTVFDEVLKEEGF